MHRGGERVIGGLAHIDVVIGVDGFLRTLLSPGHFDGPVRDHFIDVHVGLGARTGLPNTQWEFIHQNAVGHFSGRTLDEFSLRAIQFAERVVHPSAGQLQNPEGTNEGRRHSVVADFEVVQTALRLGAPVLIAGDFDLPHGVGFNTKFAHSDSLFLLGVQGDAFGN